MFTEGVHFKAAVQLQAFAEMSSMFYLAAISIEKSHSILRPMCHVIMPIKYCVIDVSSVWLLAGFLSGLILLALFGYVNKQVINIVILGTFRFEYKYEIEYE